MKTQLTNMKCLIVILTILFPSIITGELFGQAAKDKPARPPAGLAVVVKHNGLQMEAKFTNNTELDLGIRLGQQKLLLSPGKSKKLLFKNRQKFEIWESSIRPQDGKRQYKKLRAQIMPPQPVQINIPVKRR